jgi:hypothetical protein
MAKQECPGIEYATGLTVRFGKHVNAVGLICSALIADGQPAKDWLPGEENQIDRPGSDFSSFPVASGEPAQCRAACLSQGVKCASWTYVKPGFQGPEAMCFLKKEAPATFRNPCCISGVHPKIKKGSGDPPPIGPNVGDMTRERDGRVGPKKPNPDEATDQGGGIAKVPSNAGCNPPFVQRRARSSDTVCVTRGSFATVQDENASAPSRWDRNGAYGIHTCISGFVWREAFEGDVVCVTPERRTVAQEENRLDPSRAK